MVFVGDGMRTGEGWGGWMGESGEPVEDSYS